MIIVVLIRQWMKVLALSINGFTPKIETPVDKSTIELILIGVLDNDSPVADSSLAPILLLEL